MITPTEFILRVVTDPSGNYRTPLKPNANDADREIERLTRELAELRFQLSAALQKRSQQN